MAGPYVLRFFFDAGAGVCFWAGNDAARAEFGYAVDLDSIPLTAETRAAVGVLMDRYDASFNWDDPGGESLWSPTAENAFFADARQLVDKVREELGPTFEIRDELE
jgi:hypothetical protein